MTASETQSAVSKVGQGTIMYKMWLGRAAWRRLGEKMNTGHRSTVCITEERESRSPVQRLSDSIQSKGGYKFGNHIESGMLDCQTGLEFVPRLRLFPDSHGDPLVVYTLMRIALVSAAKGDTGKISRSAYLKSVWGEPPLVLAAVLGRKVPRPRRSRIQPAGPRSRTERGGYTDGLDPLFCRRRLAMGWVGLLPYPRYPGDRLGPK